MSIKIHTSTNESECVCVSTAMKIKKRNSESNLLAQMRTKTAVNLLRLLLYLWKRRNCSSVNKSNRWWSTTSSATIANYNQFLLNIHFSRNYSMHFWMVAQLWDIYSWMQLVLNNASLEYHPYWFRRLQWFRIFFTGIFHFETEKNSEIEMKQRKNTLRIQDFEKK